MNVEDLLKLVLSARRSMAFRDFGQRKFPTFSERGAVR